MITINYQLNNSLILEAYGFEKLRDSCKKYLSKNELNFDKFTIVSHDSFIGYITEHLVKDYIIKNYSSIGIDITSWEECFDIVKIRNIVTNNLDDEESKNYVRDYFYDSWDLKISFKNIIVKIDVKTALTSKNPSIRWNFMYPVIQANKDGKDCMVLSYYVVDSVKDIESLNKLVIVGYTTRKLINKCRIIKKGEKTRFGTISQIDNYETELSVHYKSIDKMIKYITSKA